MTTILYIVALVCVVPLSYLTYVHLGSRLVLFCTLLKTCKRLPTLIAGRDKDDNFSVGLRWDNLSAKLEVLAEGESRIVGFDFYDDHADHQWHHIIFRHAGQLYAEQRTFDYGHAARHYDGLYINGRKLRKGQVRKIPDGANVCQLDRFGQGPRVVKLDLRDAVELRAVA